MMDTILRALRSWPRASFIACNVALFAVGLYGAFAVCDALNERDFEIATKRETLARLNSMIVREADVQKAARQLDENQDEFLKGSIEGVIGADLQTRIKSIAEHNGARIQTIQGQPTQAGEGVKYIGAQLSLVGKLQDIHHTIDEIENSKPYLFVTNASLKLATSPVQPGASQEPTLEARLDVVGAIPVGLPKP